MNKDVRDVLQLYGAQPSGIHTLSTVVAVEGSAYRRPGARMLQHESGVVVGSVSGGCLEREIQQRGRFWAQKGPTLRSFHSLLHPEADEASAPGCGGTIHVLIENVSSGNTDSSALSGLQWVAQARAAACLVTVVRSGHPGLIARRFGVTVRASWYGGVAGRSLATRFSSFAHDVLKQGKSRLVRDVYEGEPIELFFEYLPAPRQLLLAGRHHDVAPLVRMTKLLGWEVCVAASGVSPTYLGIPDRLIGLDASEISAWMAEHAGAAVVLMTHSFSLDRQLLSAVLSVAVPRYLGVLGPRHRTLRMLQGLSVAPAALSSLRTPVGLDLGGEGPEAIAVSIAADLQATWYGRQGVRLSEPGAFTDVDAHAALIAG